MFLPDDYEQPEEQQQECSEMTGRQLCYMFSVALISSEEKLKYENTWFRFSEKEARSHIDNLQNSMPVMGLHAWPHSVIEFGQAIKYQVAKDDLHELRFKKCKERY